MSDLAPGTARCFEVGGHRIALVRTGEEFHAVADRCSHADFSLSEGPVWEAERQIECPKHGSAFSLITGMPQSFPATTPVRVYAVTVEDDQVLVDLADPSDVIADGHEPPGPTTSGI
ncbi:MAG: non-heme iron oxygenase ferredoxin subunit [Acidimicrobiales bacterium]